MEKLDIKTGQSIDKELFANITIIRNYLLSKNVRQEGRIDFGSAYLQKTLGGNKTCQYLGLIFDSEIHYPIDLFAIEMNHQVDSAYAICGEFCIEIDRNTYLEQFERCEKILDLVGGIEIASDKSELLAILEQTVYSETVRQKLDLLGFMSESYIDDMSSISRAYYEFSKDIVAQRNEQLMTIKESLAIPSHR